MRTSLKTLQFLSFAFGALAITGAWGDEACAPKSADLTSCRALGEGFKPIPGARGCARIQGYIAVRGEARAIGVTAPAGGVFATTPLAAKAPAFAAYPPESLGGDRLYVQFGSDAQHE
jgi:hypothetical protein